MSMFYSFISKIMIKENGEGGGWEQPLGYTLIHPLCLSVIEFWI